jgi:Flp pilus assembly CpaF family ATPase
MVDARLPDGSRVNIIIPPLALNGPCMSIRKFAKAVYSVEDSLRYDTLSQDMAHFCGPACWGGSTSSSRAARPAAKRPC